MSNSLWAPGREVLYVRSNTKELVDATIVGPSDEGDDYIVLRYVRGGREFTNCAAPRHAVQFHVRSPSPCRSLSPAPSSSARPSPEPSPLRSRSRSHSPKVSPPRGREKQKTSEGKPSPSRSRSHSPEVSLPQGWEKQKTPEGKPFYINHRKRETTWTPPPPSYYAVCENRPKPTGRKAEPQPSADQRTLLQMFNNASQPAERRQLDAPATPMELDCQKRVSQLRRTRAEIAAKPKRQHRSTREKLRIVQYSKAYGVRKAANKFKVAASSICGTRGWEQREEELKRDAHRRGGHRKTLHAGKQSRCVISAYLAIALTLKACHTSACA